MLDSATADDTPVIQKVHKLQDLRTRNDNRYVRMLIAATKSRLVLSWGHTVSHIPEVQGQNAQVTARGVHVRNSATLDCWARNSGEQSALRLRHRKNGALMIRAISVAFQSALMSEFGIPSDERPNAVRNLS